MESCRQCKCWSLPVDARWWIKNNQWKLNISCRFSVVASLFFFCWEVLWKHPENWGSDEGNCVDYFFINWVAIMLFSWLWNHYGHFYLVVAYYNPYSNRTSDAPSLVATGIQGVGWHPPKKKVEVLLLPGPPPYFPKQPGLSELHYMYTYLLHPNELHTMGLILKLLGSVLEVHLSHLLAPSWSNCEANPCLLKSKIGKRKHWKTHPCRQTFGNLFYPINLITLGSPENEPLEEKNNPILGSIIFSFQPLVFEGICLYRV